MQQKAVPINELAAAVIAILGVSALLVLTIMGRPIPGQLSALNGAIMLYYFNAASYSTGYSHGRASQKSDDGGGS